MTASTISDEGRRAVPLGAEHLGTDPLCELRPGALAVRFSKMVWVVTAVLPHAVINSVESVIHAKPSELYWKSQVLTHCWVVMLARRWNHGVEERGRA